MAIYRDGLKYPTEIYECAMMQHVVRVVCLRNGCGNLGMFDPHELWALFHRKGWSQSFRDASPRFWCRPCSTRLHFKSRANRVEDAGSQHIVTHHLPIRVNERDWKNFISRHRG
jgi:hypothetical protein